MRLYCQEINSTTNNTQSDAEIPNLIKKFEIVANPSIFPQLTCFFIQQEIHEEEAVQAALRQVELEKKAAQHGLLLRRNVEGVKLEVAHCLSLEAVHCLLLRMQCEIVISRVFQELFQTILFLLLVLLQKALDREQSFPFKFTPPGYKSL